MEKLEELKLNPKLESLIKEVIKIIQKYIDKPFKIYLFGSLARGDATEFSDIDLAIQTIESINHRTLRKIRNEIDNLRTLRKIDLKILLNA